MAVKEPKITPSSSGARREPEYVDKPSPFSIEGIRSGAVQSRVVKTMIVLSGVIMAGGFIMSGLQPTGIPQAGGRAQQASETVATVGGQNISGGQLEQVYASSENFNRQIGQPTTVASFLSKRQDALKQLTNNAALIEAAQKANISVSDAETDAEIDKQLSQSPQFKPQPGQSEGAFLRAIQAQYKVTTLAEALDAFKKERVTPEVREQVRQKLLVDKLGQQSKNATVTSEDDYKRSVTKLDLYQILIRPELPKGTSKDFKGDSGRLAEAARAKAAKVFAALKANPTLANFKATALKESGDAATKSKGGSLGLKLPAQIGTPELGEQLSRSAQNLIGPLDAPADVPGTQVIYFIGARKTELPRDYDKNKKKLLADFQKSRGEAAWQKKQDELQKAVTPQVSEPALAAFQLQSDLYTKQGADQTRARDEALADYDTALKSATGQEAAAIHYQKSVLFRDQGKMPEQIEALKAAAAGAKSDVQTQLALAQALQSGGQPKVALEQFKATSLALDDNPTPPSMFGTPSPDNGIRQQLAAQFELLKQPKLAAAERAKIKVAPPGGGGLNMGGLPPGVQIQGAPK